QQLLTQQTTIPSRLLTSYASFGLDEREVMTIIHIHRFLQIDNGFPTPEELASLLTINEKECSNVLRKLIQKGFLTIVQSQNDQQQISETYSLDPLWEKLFSPKAEENIPEGSLFIL